MSKKSITEKVNEFLTKHSLHGKTFVVGFSGGFDSMCLLKILSELDTRLVAAHFNHGWRDESDEEENRCREFCETLGIEFYSEQAPKDLKKTETDARNARYEFFLRVVSMFNADGIFTAHNSDDNAETLIYRIIKGTGVYGLQGIAEKRGNIYRPLLGVARREIEAYCAEKGLSPNVDSSNNDTKYKRNFIRHKILPMMSEINKDVKNAVNKLSESAKTDTAVVEEYLSIIVRDVVEGDRINTQRFLELSNAVRKRLLYSFLSTRLLEYDYKRVEEIMEFILSNSDSVPAVKYSVTSGVWLSVNKKNIIIYKEEELGQSEIYVDKEGEYRFENGVFSIECCDEVVKSFPADSEGVAYVDLSREEFPLVFRMGRATDEITPLGMNGKMKLKKYLSGKKVEQHLRAKTPVLAKGNKVLWIPTVGLSAEVKIEDKPTHKLTWKENA